ncbi:hypothetical protein ABZ916_39320 [Streptomyces sp. NPDC046853]|uniref:hypothetical protein n=1 Tax=Streptomyces sp. NPDC046853 TaxID=3154920 RepID=UPI0033D0DAD9
MSDQRPDYAKIDRLERELGIAQLPAQKPIRSVRTVCLTKNCAGDTEELRSWSGILLMRIRTCRKTA